MWGFGYAPLSKKYKYITVLLADKQQKPPLISAIFTLGEKRICRKFDIKPFIMLYFGSWSLPALYHNGALYWTVAHVANGDKSVPHLVSLDLDTEKFRRLQEVWVPMDEAKNIWVQKYRYFALKPGLYGVEFTGSCSVDFTLSGFWQNQELYGLERTYRLSFTPQRIEHISPSGHSLYEIYETRCLSYNKDSETYTALHLPFAKDASGQDILPRFVTTHIGSLVSPSKIVAAAQMAS
ncbi:hypothetical protein FRX31_027389 [Thalictrum thalictroides]|uniref:F-box associated domain-containing protein n=1 Tax=Thalictrum thalictroides TaxID=46969 RepID=A0A7J6VD42_THATH|nr:hypothetical protein FRX31_027389 [Thalictrum thalictroides]